MAITRDSRHKRRATGGRRHPHSKKAKYETGRPGANTKLGPKRIHLVRARGGNQKFRAMRLENGNFSWGSLNITKKTRVMDVVYNASNNELVRTKTLVKNAIVSIDATPFRQYYESHFRFHVAKKAATEEDVSKFTREVVAAEKKESELTAKKYATRQAEASQVIDPKIEEQLVTGRVLAVITSRPGQSGRCDGYILEGPELEFYQRKLNAKRATKK